MSRFEKESNPQKNWLRSWLGEKETSNRDHSQRTRHHSAALKVSLIISPRAFPSSLSITWLLNLQNFVKIYRSTTAVSNLMKSAQELTGIYSWVVSSFYFIVVLPLATSNLARKMQKPCDQFILHWSFLHIWLHGERHLDPTFDLFTWLWTRCRKSPFIWDSLFSPV